MNRLTDREKAVLKQVKMVRSELRTKPTSVEQPKKGKGSYRRHTKHRGESL